MQPKSPDEIKMIIAQLKELGDDSTDLDLWQGMYELLPPDQQAEISQLLEKELVQLSA